MKYFWKYIAFTFIISFFIFEIKSQCLDADFLLPKDSVCVSEEFTIINNSTKSDSYFWDICSGDFLLTPEYGESYTVPNSAWSSSIRYVYDEVNSFWIGLSPTNPSGINRMIHTKGLENEPTPALYPYTKSVFYNPADIQFYKEKNKWYAFVVSSADNELYRLEFGTSIGSVPVVEYYRSELDDVLPAIKPRGLNVQRDNDSIFVAITSGNSDTLTMINLGNSVKNNLQVKHYSLGFSESFGADNYQIELVKVCNNWVGFLGNASISASGLTASLIRLDFGNSLWNEPTIHRYEDIQKVTGLKLINDNDNWILIAVQNKYLVRINFGDDIFNPLPAVDTIQKIGSVNFLEHVYYNSENYIFYVTLGGVATLRYFKFPNNCNSSNPNFNSKDINANYDINVDSSITQYISLKSKDEFGNIDYSYDSITVLPALPFEFSSDDTLCNDTIRFTIDTILTPEITNSYLWDFGDGNTSTDKNPVHVYKDAGSYEVSINISSSIYGCGGSKTKTVNINRVYPKFFVDDGFVTPPMQFVDSTSDINNSITDWYWDFGDGNISTEQSPSHYYEESGKYLVKFVTGIGDCVGDTAYDSITFVPRPDISYDVKNNCENDSTEFINNTVLNAKADSIKSYLWDFGNGETSTLKNPKAYYADSGMYKIKLKVFSYKGYIDSLIGTIRVYKRAIPDFNFPPIGCVKNNVSFIDVSKLQKDTINAWYWDFGDGIGSDSVQNPNYSFIEDNEYNVSLTVFTGNKCDSTSVKTIKITKSPLPGFVVNQTCAESAISFTDTSTSPEGTNINIWNWDFGDGNTSNEQNPEKVFDSAGNYIVKLQIINSANCVGELIDSNLRVAQLPDVSFIPIEGCDNDSIRFSDFSRIDTDGLDTLKIWNWNFGHISSGLNNNSSLKNPSHYFDSAGLYNVNLEVISNYNCKTSLTKSINVKKSPKAQFDYSSGCDGKVIAFTDKTNTNAEESIANWYWNFNNESTSNIQNPVFGFDSLGYYAVTLIVQSVNGCFDTITKSVFAESKSIFAKIYSDKICKNSIATFVDSSYSENAVISYRRWTFPNGETYTTNTVDYTFPSSGEQDIKLYIRTKQGCEDETIKTVTVHDNPISQFSISPTYGEPPLNVELSDNSIDADSVVWNFGDDNIINDSKSHLYLDSGIYRITQYSYNSFDCLDSSYTLIKVMIPYIELELENLNAEVNGDYLDINLSFINNGTREVDSVYINAMLDNGTIIKELYTGLLKTGNEVDYEFNSSYKIPDGGFADYVCVWISTPESEIDILPDNNSQCYSIFNESAVLDPYPNPANSEINIDFVLSKESFVRISLYDNSGKVLDELYSDNARKGLNNIKYNIEYLNVGKYSYIVEFDDKRFVRSFIVE